MSIISRARHISRRLIPGTIVVVAIAAAVALTVSGPSASAAVIGPFTHFDVPGAINTDPTGVAGPNVVGSYYDGTATHAFVYNYVASTYTTIDAPDAGSYDTQALGIGGPGGKTVVGAFRDSGGFGHGFTYNLLSSVWTQFDGPGGVETSVTGISAAGNKLVGVYDNFNTGDGHGFIDDGVNFTTVDDPAEPHNALHAIRGDGAVVVGTHDPNYGAFEQGFSYDGSSFTELSFPGADRTAPYGISGGRIVGNFGDSGFTVAHGFVYEAGTWTEVNDPAYPNATALYGIDGDTIVGSYHDASGNSHGLITSVPEPGSMGALIALAACSLAARRRRRALEATV